MATHAAPSTTGDRKVAKLFGLEGESWMKHANPASVWTRFSVVSLLALSIWSRDLDRHLVPDPDRALVRLDVREPVAPRRAGVDSQLGLAQRPGRADLSRPRQGRTPRAVPLAGRVAGRQWLLDDRHGRSSPSA